MRDDRKICSVAEFVNRRLLIWTCDGLMRAQSPDALFALIHQRESSELIWPENPEMNWINPARALFAPPRHAGANLGPSFRNSSADF
jgi:hypothetical protein